MQPVIEKVQGREIIDSRGNPTIEVEIHLSDSTIGRASVPSGASTGSHEAVELRDGDENRFGGKGVLTAIQNIHHVAKSAIIGMSPFIQQEVDQTLVDFDGTANKAKLGANAILGISLAVAHAAANSKKKPLYRSLGGGNLLPVPMFNILNGGKHAESSTDIQEFMVVPVGAPTFSEAVRSGAEIYQSLRQVLQKEGYNTNMGDEGGFAPSLPTNQTALQLIVQAINMAGYHAGKDVLLALDVAASELTIADDYVLLKEGVTYNSQELVGFYENLVNNFPIISIEDGMSEDDWDGWQILTERLGDRVQLVGDDLLTTNVTRINRAISARASNALLVKPNQIGTLTETFEAVNLVRDAGWGAILSHRSGETEDTTIADLAVATSVGQIKSGAPARSERVAKYNRLIRIEEELGSDAKYGGIGIYKHLTR